MEVLIFPPRGLPTLTLPMSVTPEYFMEIASTSGSVRLSAALFGALILACLSHHDKPTNELGTTLVNELEASWRAQENARG